MVHMDLGLLGLVLEEVGEGDVNEVWEKARDGLLMAASEACGWTKGPPRHVHGGGMKRLGRRWVRRSLSLRHGVRQRVQLRKRRC